MSLTNKLYKSRKVIIDMLNDRDIDTTKYNNYSPEEIDILYDAGQKIIKDLNPIDMELKMGSINSLTVKYMLTSKIRVLNIMTVVEDMLEDEHSPYKSGDTIIIVICEKLKHPELLETFFDNMYNKHNIFCQLFHLNMLMYNVTKHSIVPKHVIINETEKNNLLKKYNLTSDEQLPLILKTDPVAKYLGMKKGQVCRIIRSSETHGIFTSYRLCQ
jgi:DNA-directed RNA polymerase I, II, and III subunit RPABC1